MNELSEIPYIDPEFMKQLLNDPKLLYETAYHSFFYFFHYFFGRYIEYPIAPFHIDMFNIAQDSKLKRAVVLTFRSSAKSTILNTAYILWAIMGVQQHKHIVIASQTQYQAKDHLDKIKKEFERNELLRKFFGPFQEKEDRWNSSLIIIPKYEARISTVSLEQEGIRGMREGPHRPSLIIVDDIEDSSSTKSKEMRDKTFRWITGELFTIGDKDTKVVFLGNFLHDDCTLMRIANLILEKKMDGIFCRIPLVYDNGKIAWPGKYPDQATVERHRRDIGNDPLWHREFLLKFVPEERQPIKANDIHTYDISLLPTIEADTGGLVAIGIDPAFGQEEHNDFTAMVSGKLIYGSGNTAVIYILPNPINERWDFSSILHYAKSLRDSRPCFHHEFFIENVQAQSIIVQEFIRSGLSATPMHALGNKHTRLQIVANHIKNGTVVFPSAGCERLLEQLLNFGMEAHDDLVDALVYLILGVVNSDHFTLPTVWSI